MSKSSNIVSRKIISREFIKNFSLVSKLTEDYSYIKDFIKTYAYRFEPYEFPSREDYVKAVTEWEEKGIELLSDNAKLAYEIEL